MSTTATIEPGAAVDDEAAKALLGRLLGARPVDAISVGAQALPHVAPQLFTDPPTTPADDIRALVVTALREWSAASPRSKQKSIGASEAGTPCTRRLAYRMLDVERTNVDTDPYPSMVGTAFHVTLAEVFAHPAWQGRFLVEQRVEIRPGMPSTLDLYDTTTGDLVDWKILGATGLKNIKDDGPGPEYRIQQHLYGLGLKRSHGITPARVNLVCFPRGGMLSGLHVWSEPWDEQAALAALERLDSIVVALAQLKVEAKPEHWQYLPTADAHCSWCPFFLPHSDNLARGCPGHAPTEAPDSAR